MKQYYFVTILILSVFISLCVNAASSDVNRISRHGEYAGFSEAIYDDKYELTSQYIEVSDGTKLAMDIYRPKDKVTGKVIETPLPVIWMHTPYNRRHVSNQCQVYTFDKIASVVYKKEN
ncbi:MAG: hypothetical protein GX654_07540 [Desulfatiglans sp.]|nr:hypothetical protein [Desulfatiglans sp.]